MTVGNRSWEGAVPLVGEFECIQETAATDFMTFTGKSGMTGDFMNFRDSNKTELYTVESTGDNVLGKTDQTTFTKLQLPILNTAPASANLTKGDLWLSKATTDVYRISLCISTATGAPRYGPRFTRVTIGTASN